ncbi:MAG: hypothetical protein ACOYYU_11965 [Chloroflexota bacterium]
MKRLLDPVCHADRDRQRQLTGLDRRGILLIDENICVDDFREKLRWNDLYYHMAYGVSA